jgi:hypothetical protein
MSRRISSSTTGPAVLDALTALFDEIIAAGFQSQTGAPAHKASSSPMTGAGEDFGSLAKPHH